MDSWDSSFIVVRLTTFFDFKLLVVLRPLFKGPTKENNKEIRDCPTGSSDLILLRTVHNSFETFPKKDRSLEHLFSETVGISHPYR